LSGGRCGQSGRLRGPYGHSSFQPNSEPFLGVSAAFQEPLRAAQGSARPFKPLTIKAALPRLDYLLSRTVRDLPKRQRRLSRKRLGNRGAFGARDPRAIGSHDPRPGGNPQGVRERRGRNRSVSEPRSCARARAGLFGVPTGLSGLFCLQVRRASRDLDPVENSRGGAFSRGYSGHFSGFFGGFSQDPLPRETRVRGLPKPLKIKGPGSLSSS